MGCTTQPMSGNICLRSCTWCACFNAFSLPFFPPFLPGVSRAIFWGPAVVKRSGQLFDLASSSLADSYFAPALLSLRILSLFLHSTRSTSHLTRKDIKEIEGKSKLKFRLQTLIHSYTLAKGKMLNQVSFFVHTQRRGT